MSSTLPPPGSVWKQRESQIQMRVIYSCDSEIVAHNAEMADRAVPISSWVGTANDFFNKFDFGDSYIYPKTAA